MIPAQLWEAMCCQVTGWEGGRKWDMGVWGAFTIADDTGDLTRPMGCSYLTSARWLPTLGGHEGHAVVSGLCCAVLWRGAGCSPLTTPLRGCRQLALFAGGFAHSSSWVTRLRNLSRDRGSWEP